MATDIFDEPTTIEIPIRGEVIGVDSADGLIDAFEFVKAKEAELYACKRLIIAALDKLGTSEATTKRVQGERRRVKIEAPKIGWDQSKLKIVYEAFPELRDQALRIESVGVDKRKWDMVQRTSGPEVFEQFKGRIAEACKGPTGSPSVTIEV